MKMRNTDTRIASTNLHHKSTIIARAKIETANAITRKKLNLPSRNYLLT